MRRVTMPHVSPSPRLFCIPATAAPVVAVLRRGPSKWWNVGRWDLGRMSFEPGAWFRGSLYPQRCDLSPDGRWLSYLALKPGARWEAGSTFIAVSRLPWLTALAAWNEGTTYSRGAHFVVPGAEKRHIGDPRGEGEARAMGEPSVGDATALHRRYGLQRTIPSQFAVELRRGWSEARGSPPRAADDVWHERRPVVLEKSAPASRHAHSLQVTGLYAAFRSSPGHWPPSDSLYTLLRHGRTEVMPEVAWADWDAGGRLLVATHDARLQVRVLGKQADSDEIVFNEDVGGLMPRPQPAPGWAAEW